MKCGFVSIVGRPNVGKSTLLNSILGMKLAITSNVSGTTRNVIQGIYNDDDSQIVFVDTPGIHKPINKLGNLLNKKAYNNTEGVDVILFLVDINKGFGTGDKFILDRIKDKLANGEELTSEEQELTQIVVQQPLQDKIYDVPNKWSDDSQEKTLYRLYDFRNGTDTELSELKNTFASFIDYSTVNLYNKSSSNKELPTSSSGYDIKTVIFLAPLAIPFNIKENLFLLIGAGNTTPICFLPPNLFSTSFAIWSTVA